MINKPMREEGRSPTPTNGVVAQGCRNDFDHSQAVSKHSIELLKGAERLFCRGFLCFCPRLSFSPGHQLLVLLWVAAVCGIAAYLQNSRQTLECASAE